MVLYGGPVIDSHVHFIDRSKLEYAVVEFETVPALAKDWCEEWYLKAFNEDLGQNPMKLEACVFVEVNAKKECQAQEVEWATSIAGGDSKIGGICMSAPLEAGAAATREALDKVGGNGLVRSVRRLLQDTGNDDLAASPEYQAGVGAVLERGYACEICIRARQKAQMVAVGKLLEKFPEGKFVLNHMGKPDLPRGPGASPEWFAFISAMAKLPNTFCKISGVLTEFEPGKWNKEEARPFVMHCIREFGAKRCMFGGDWFVVLMGGPLAEWVKMLQEILNEEEVSLEDQGEIFYGTAKRFYSLN